MAIGNDIKGNVGLGIVPVLVTDTAILSLASPVERAAVTNAVLHNDGSAAAVITVEIFISPDLTSASGQRIAVYTIQDNGNVLIDTIVDQGFTAAQNIIAKADVAGCNSLLTIIEYENGS